MNWNSLHSENNKGEATNEVKEFNKDKKVNNQQIRQQLKLMTCEKIKHSFPHESLHHTPKITKGPQIEDKDILTFGAKEPIAFKRQTERLINLLMTVCSSTNFTNEQSNNVKEIINNFGRDLQELFDKYIQRFLTFSLAKQKKQEFNKKIILYIDETLKRQYINVGETTPARTQNLRQVSNRSHDSNQSGKNVNLSSKTSRFTEQVSNFQYESQVNPKNSMSKIQSSFNEVNRLLEKAIQPRFIRTSGMMSSSKKSRSQSSSVEQIFQKSLQERKKGHTNSSNSKQTLHNINRLLNE